MREPVIGSDPIGVLDTGLVDLSGVSLIDVLGADSHAIGGTALGHSVRRILGDSEDPIAGFDSAITSRYD